MPRRDDRPRGPRRPPLRRSGRDDRPALRRPGQFRVVYEDDELIVVDKPAGMLSSTPPGQTAPSLFNMLRERAGSRGRRGRIWIIHRLDRDASGLLVFAKTERAFGWLKEDIRTRRTNRLYLAVVEGGVAVAPAPAASVPGDGSSQPQPGSASSELSPHSSARGPDTRTIQSYLREDSRGHVRSLAPGEFRGGGEDEARLAVTHYRVEGTGNRLSLLRVWLQTGRKHQIRVHLSEAGHPIAGDREYGAKTSPLRRLALHAMELSFDDPATGQRRRFVSPAPASFYKAVGLPPPAIPASPAPADAGAETPTSATGRGWDHVASWYDDLIEEKRSDHFERVILPGTLRLLRPRPGMKIADVACGQGSLARALSAQGAEVLGLDASPRLIEAARRHGGGPIFEVADARELESLSRVRGWLGIADAAACVMALMNIEPVEPVIRGVAAMLRDGGAFVAVVLHPAFRAPGQTSWAWDEGDETEHGPRPARQYRRVDGYLSPGQREIVMNPGAAAHGKKPVLTITHHRPIQTYVRACAEAGLLIDALEEWPSLRQSEPGPRAGEENRARREIPMFLALRARRVRLME